MKLGIYGSGGLGREVLLLAKYINSVHSRWSEIFFIDDFNFDRTHKGHPVVSCESLVKNQVVSNVEVVIAVGEPSLRARLADKIESHGIPLAILIHPSVTVPECTTINNGCVINMGVYISCDIKIGKNVFFQPNSSIGHDSYIGDHSIVSTYVSLAGGCRIGEQVFLGMGAIVKEKTSIGDMSIIGMSSAVFGDIPAEVIALGNPARVLRKNESKKIFN
ncbi:MULTISPECIES: NeuD/PglB/VioB family sugar acetyltransferase [Dickeya]|uniref:NeuD/PglB/VioB family sugar acetyltransferase n=1 Tax=Dickeya TaxID=204037 RepID=UPI00037AFE50|nr:MULTISPECIES: NeuD/PglB/VioB family sugar acetyltransferase [Dickeya]AJC66814.1 sugar O-acyltransferase [Dickeya zeae EC1]